MQNRVHQLTSGRNRVGGKQSSFLPTFVYRPLAPPYVMFRIRPSLMGELHLYSLWLKEPERPMYLELHRIGSDILTDKDRYSKITISPNPFNSTFTANFELLTAADAKVKIFDKYGALVYSRSLGSLQAGMNSLSISPDILQGTYVLNITAGKQVLRTIIVKKGGM